MQYDFEESVLQNWRIYGQIDHLEKSGYFLCLFSQKISTCKSQNIEAISKTRPKIDDFRNLTNFQS